MGMPIIQTRSSVPFSVCIEEVLSPVLSLKGRHGGLMVSALDSRSSGPGLSLGQGTVLCSLASHFTISASHHPGV